MKVRYDPEEGTIYASRVITSIMQCLQACKLLPVSLFVYHLHFQLAKNAFYPYLCNFTQVCLGFFNKSFSFIFPMVFNGTPTPSIPEPASVQRLLYIKTNDPGIVLVYSFINFVIPLPATYVRHFRYHC